MWESLGFRESPYNTHPLMAKKEDVELLIGRETEAVDLCTNLETADNGILILSGAPGVGKTSFLNVQQYLLENGLAPFGPKILSARKLCPVQPTDSVKILAVRAIDSLLRSIEGWCRINSVEVPAETKKIGQWLAGTNHESSIKVCVVGFNGNSGRNLELPSLAESTFESIVDAITVLTSEVVAKLGFRSAVIALDNLENFNDDQLSGMLISFRDTLFSTPNLWWVLIGQSGLGSLIQSLDARVFERITGSGIEIRPIEVEELDTAISIRVSRFHKSGNGKAPLPIETHKQLFQASFGEMRFVFKYSNAICVSFVGGMRKRVLEIRKAKSQSFEGTFASALDRVIAEDMINKQIPHDVAIIHLRAIVESELNGLFLKPKEKQVLNAIGDAGNARASDFKRFSLKTMQEFSRNYLTRFYQQNLLVREQEGRAVNYRLRGIALLSHGFGFLK
jgi:hypothetical protein